MATEKTAGFWVLALGALIEIANWYPTSRGMVDALKNSGGTGAVMADAFLSPVFGLVVIVVGLLMIYRGRPKNEPPPPSSSGSSIVVSPTISPTFHNIINIPGQQPESSEPKLVVGECRVVRAWIGRPHLRAPKGDFVEASFLNHSEGKRRETALGVVGHVSFFLQDGTPLFGPMEYGRWVHVPEPQHERFLDAASRTDIPPDGMAKRLNIALKLVTDVDAFGFSNESIVAGDIWRLERYRLRPGIYKVKARLLGANVDQTFWFELVNMGGDRAPVLRQSEQPPQMPSGNRSTLVSLENSHNARIERTTHVGSGDSIKAKDSDGLTVSDFRKIEPL